MFFKDKKIDKSILFLYGFHTTHNVIPFLKIDRYRGLPKKDFFTVIFVLKQQQQQHNSILFILIRFDWIKFDWFDFKKKMSLLPFASEELPLFAQNAVPMCHIKSVQFVLEDDEETLRTSCFGPQETILHTKLMENGYFLPNGLCDSRMGGGNERTVCSTCERKKCNDNLISCVGHISHNKLFVPVFQTECLSELASSLNCVCYNCSEFYPAMIIHYQNTHPDQFLSKNHGTFENFMCRLTLKGIARATRIAAEVSKIVKKGFMCLRCRRYGRIWTSKTPFLSYAQILRPNKPAAKMLEKRADVVQGIIHGVDPKVWQYIGFENPASTPKAYIVQVMPIPPPQIRPHLVVSENNMTHNHEITQLLLVVQTANMAGLLRLKFLRRRDGIIRDDIWEVDHACMILRDLLQGCCALYWSGDTAAGPLAEKCHALSSHLPVTSCGAENPAYFARFPITSSSSSTSMFATGNNHTINHTNNIHEQHMLQQQQQKKKRRYLGGGGNNGSGSGGNNGSGGKSGKNNKTNANGVKRVYMANILRAKDGLFRRYIRSSRTENGWRVVIGIDPDARPDEIVLPKDVSMVCTQAKRVCKYNQKTLSDAAWRGPNDLYGAKRIHRDERIASDTFALSFSDINRHELLQKHFDREKQRQWNRSSENRQQQQQQKTKVQKQEPFHLLTTKSAIVEVHLRPRTVVMVGRQPTLHRASLQCRPVARIDNKSKTMKKADSGCAQYNSDFDGDEMNGRVAQGMLARAECQELMHPRETLLDDATGRVMYGLVQMRILGAEQLSHSETLLDEREMLYYLGIADMQTTIRPTRPGFEYTPFSQYLHKLVPPAILYPQRRWTGRQLISMITPWCIRTEMDNDKLHSLTVHWKDNNNNEDKKTSSSSSPTTTQTTTYTFALTRYKFLMRNGHFMVGLLTKEHVAVGKHPLTLQIHQLWGPQCALDWVHNFGQVAMSFIYDAGWTIRATDFCVPTPVLEEIKTVMDARTAKAEDLVRVAHQKQLKTQGFTSDLSVWDAEPVLQVLRGARDKCGDILLKSVVPYKNQLQSGILSGARGSTFCSSQMLAVMGQQQIDNMFPEQGFRERAFPSVPRRAPALDTKGNISVGIAQGLTPKEAFAQSQAGRDGTIKTAMGTATNGTAQRQLVSGLQSVILRQNRAACDDRKAIVQWVYGHDGIDCQRQCWVSLPYLWKSVLDLEKQMDGAPEEWTSAVKQDQLLLQEFQFKRGVSKLDHTFAMAFQPELFSHAAKSCHPCKTMADSITAQDAWAAITMLIHAIRKEAGVPVSTFLLECALHYYLRPENLLPISASACDQMCTTMLDQYGRSLSQPGTSIGYIAGSSISEPGTQTTQNIAKTCGKENMHTDNTNRLNQVIHYNSGSSGSNNNGTSSSSYIQAPLVEPLCESFDTAAALVTMLHERTIYDIATSVEIRRARTDRGCGCEDDTVQEERLVREFEEIASPLLRRFLCWQHITNGMRGRKASTSTTSSSNSSGTGTTDINVNTNDNNSQQDSHHDNARQQQSQSTSSFKRQARSSSSSSSSSSCFSFAAAIQQERLLQQKQKQERILRPPESEFVAEDDADDNDTDTDNDDNDDDDDDDDRGDDTKQQQQRRQRQLKGGDADNNGRNDEENGDEEDEEFLVKSGLQDGHDGFHPAMVSEFGFIDTVWDAEYVYNGDDDDDDDEEDDEEFKNIQDHLTFDLRENKSKPRQGQWAPYVVCIKLDMSKCIELQHTPGTLCAQIAETFGCEVETCWTGAVSDEWQIRARVFIDEQDIPQIEPSQISKTCFDEGARRKTDPLFYLVQTMCTYITQKLVISGCPEVTDAGVTSACHIVPCEDVKDKPMEKQLKKEFCLIIYNSEPVQMSQLWYLRQEDWHIHDPPSVFPNYGILMMERFIEQEIEHLYESIGIEPCHTQMVAARMTSSGRIYSFTRSGIQPMLVSSLSGAFFEDPNTQLRKAAARGAEEPLAGGMDSLFVAAPLNYGADNVELLTDEVSPFRPPPPVIPPPPPSFSSLSSSSTYQKHQKKKHVSFLQQDSVGVCDASGYMIANCNNKDTDYSNMYSNVDVDVDDDDDGGSGWSPKHKPFSSLSSCSSSSTSVSCWNDGQPRQPHSSWNDDQLYNDSHSKHFPNDESESAVYRYSENSPRYQNMDDEDVGYYHHPQQDEINEHNQPLPQPHIQAQEYDIAPSDGWSPNRR